MNNMIREKELYCSFKAKGLRLTDQRRFIINCLAAKKGALSAEDIKREAKENDQDIDLATVYRNLEKLEIVGMIERVGLELNKAYYRICIDSKHEHHFLCLGCRRSFSIPYCPLQEEDISKITPKNFQVTGHRYEVYGYCQGCS